MAKVKIDKVMTGIEDSLKGYIARTKMMNAFYNRVTYKDYQNRQRRRWMTENTSEGDRWKPLDSKSYYARTKPQRFRSFPGKGTKLMIATGRLMGAVVGGKDDIAGEHRKIITGTRLEVHWTTPYAVYTEKIRPVNVWDELQDRAMYDSAAAYLMKGVMRNIINGGE